MNHRMLMMTLLTFAVNSGCSALPTLEQPSAPQAPSNAEARREPIDRADFATSPQAAWWSLMRTSFVQFEGDNGKKDNGQAEQKEGPEHMRDNGFLVEEASNQEPGVAQHIFNWVNFWKHGDGTRSRDFLFSYTMELPVCSQKHQFSFTPTFLTNFESSDPGPGTQQGDVGDTFINYRYQLLANDDFLWCAPRASLILPTGDKRLGTGTGEVGYQCNLPVSHYGANFDVHFNAGYTVIPEVSVPLDAPLLLSPQHDLRALNLGVSVFWKPETYLHFFVEGFALWSDRIEDDGSRNMLTQILVNPGVRYAVIQDPVEWVLGVSVPIGLTRDTPDIGVFAYMSIEHSFRAKKNGNGE